MRRSRRRAASRGAAEAITGRLDVQAVLDRRDEIIHDLDDSAQLPWLEDRGITLLRGVGELTGERRLRVGDEELEATRAVILATGSLPSMPPIEGLDAIDDAWTNREATTAKAIPERLVIMGGGVVGVEMAQAFQTLGAQVTLIEGEHRLLPREEEFACAEVTEALEGYGVDIRTGQKATEVAEEGGTVTVSTSDGAEAEGDTLLVALGRKPQTKGLGLEALGVDTDRPVSVDARMVVDGHPWLYAIGDVNGRALFTHMGKYQARVAADHILGTDTSLSHGADGPLSPRVIFTEPQVAAVGHTSDTAAEAGLVVDVVETSTSGNAGGSFYGHDAPGTSRLLIDRERHVVVGATITGAEVAEHAACGHDRDRRRGPARAAPARRAVLPDSQRDLAVAVGGSRGLNIAAVGRGGPSELRWVGKRRRRRRGRSDPAVNEDDAKGAARGPPDDGEPSTG